MSRSPAAAVDLLHGELGLPNMSFEVGDLQAAVDAVAADGYWLVGGIGEYEGSVRTAQARGPGGDHRSLFEQFGWRAPLRRRSGSQDLVKVTLYESHRTG